MKRRATAVILGCLMASPLSAQDRDAQVLSPGQLRLFAGGEFGHFSSIFSNAGTVPFDGGYGGPLTPESFGALTPFASRLDEFFASTVAQAGGGTSDASQMNAGDLAIELGWSTRYFPLGVSLGLLPRVEIGARVAVFRNERYTRRFDLDGGNLGVNPDAVGNAALMSGISADWGEIGSSAVLPVQGSPLAVELQHRVLQLTGEQLVLPESPLDVAQLETAYEIVPIPRLLSEWRPGDLEIEARVAVARSFAGLHPPAASGFEFRVAANGALRLPTGRRGDGNPLVERGPEVGFSGARAGLDADLFLGDRGWITLGGAFTRYGEREVLVAIVPPGGPYASDIELVEAEFARGDELNLWFTPRLFLTREVTFGLGLTSEHWREGSRTLAGDPVEVAGGSRQAFGFSIRYSTLPRFEAGEAIQPFDVAIGYRGAFRGSAGIPALRNAFVQVSLIPRLWGGD